MGEKFGMLLGLATPLHAIAERIQVKQSCWYEETWVAENSIEVSIIRLQFPTYLVQFSLHV
jgi:hypothetical protein